MDGRDRYTRSAVGSRFHLSWAKEAIAGPPHPVLWLKSSPKVVISGHCGRHLEILRRYLRGFLADLQGDNWAYIWHPGSIPQSVITIRNVTRFNRTGASVLRGGNPSRQK